MSPENPDEVPVNVLSDAKEPESSEETKSLTVEELENLLGLERQKVSDCQDKIKQVLADYQNLSKKTQSDIEKGVNSKIDGFMLEFLNIYDDFIRAKEAYSQKKIDTSGLDGILKNMNSFLSRNNVAAIEALGEIFDPNYHEAISITTDSDLDENTITKEIRKGYISQNRVIRPTLVEISKKG